MDHRRKILTLAQAMEQARSLAGRGLRLVFTNGCFDLLHPGHLRYLAEARALGDFLLVGLNSDRSIRAIKGGQPFGPPRPICSEAERAEMLAGLEAVDAVVIFDEETPLELILALEPSILAKGGDYDPALIVGGAEVLARGGQVRSLTLAGGFSTTALVGRILGRP